MAGTVKDSFGNVIGLNYDLHFKVNDQINTYNSEYSVLIPAIH